MNDAFTSALLHSARWLLGYLVPIGVTRLFADMTREVACDIHGQYQYPGVPPLAAACPPIAAVETSACSP